jgi:hypothetical protein
VEGPLRSIACGALIIAIVTGGRSARAEAPSPIAAQLSMSIAVGKASDDLWFGHLWGGVGAHWVGGPADGAFLLAGLEADLRGPATDDDDREGDEMERGQRDFGPPPTAENLTELWMVGRAGMGWFGDWKWAPQASLYAVVGMRASGPDEAPRLRLGAGASLPAALPLAYFGIPTMVETGFDAESSGEPARAFLRAGWNF